MTNFYTVVLYVILYVVESAALFFLFDKAGEKSYKGLIPIYRYYILFKLTWHTAYFYPYIVLKIILGILNYYYDILVSYDEFTFALVLFSLVMLAVGIVLLLLEIKQKIQMSLAFSRKKSFAIGLVLLPHIFLYTLTFSKRSVYIGPQNEKED